MSELAKRAVAVRKHWRWMPGMALANGARVSSVDQGRLSTPGGQYSAADALPDLEDFATLGCLLHLVRVAWRQPAYATQEDATSWYVSWDASAYQEYEGETEAEALVKALEAAPNQGRRA